MLAVSQVVLISVGALVCVLSAWGIFSPARLIAMVGGAMARPWGIYVAVIVRLLLGAALILAAPASRFPTAFEVLGWIAIAAAVALLLIGRAPMRGLVAWFSRLPGAAVRAWLVIGFAFGLFLIYGVIWP